MERREQRVRRDRKKDGRRNPVQKDEDRETTTKNTITQKSDPSATKENDKKSEVTTGESTIKDKVVEDDPLRFANLKRETDEIAALKAKKPQKRQVFSNWWRYEEPLPSTNESQALDFETLLHAPQSGNFKFKSEAQWDAGSFGQFGELFMPDAELLAVGLTSIPFYLRLGVDKSLLLEDEVKKMDVCAKANSVTYEKVNKSKQKPKRDVTNLFNINYSDEYAVMDKENVPPREEGADKLASKLTFVVEQSPEPAVSTVKRSTHNAQPTFPSRESTPVKECKVDVVPQDLHFGKPNSLLASAGSVNGTPHLSRESTPAKDVTSEASRDFDFGRPQFSTSSLQHAPHIRERTPAKEIVSQSVSGQLDSKSQPRPPAPSSERYVVESKEELEVTSHPTIKTVVPPQDSVLNQEDGRNSLADLSTAEPLDEISSKELVQRIDSDNIEDQSMKLANPEDGNLVSEQRTDENSISAPEKHPNKGAKVENKKDNSQKGGSKHSRKKKGQQSSTQEQTDVANRHSESIGVENTSDETIRCSVPKAVVPVVRDEPESKSKPEQLPPPVLPQLTLGPDTGPPKAGTTPPASDKRAPQAPVTKLPSASIGKPGVQGDDDHLNFLMSLKGQKAAGVSEVEATKSLKSIAVARSAIEEDELKESQKPKAPPAITTEKKEDLEDWLDSMLDD